MTTGGNPTIQFDNQSQTGRLYNCTPVVAYPVQLRGLTLSRKEENKGVNRTLMTQAPPTREIYTGRIVLSQTRVVS